MHYVSLLLSGVGALLFHFIPQTDGYAFLFKKEMGYIVGFLSSILFTILSVWLSILDFKKKKYIKTKGLILIYVMTWLVSCSTVLYLASLL